MELDKDYKILLDLYKTGNVQAYQDYILKLKSTDKPNTKTRPIMRD